MSVATTALKTDAYRVTDDFFGAPFIDVDQWREKPAPHRHVHGGFEGTDTRFTFYFPDETDYEGRMYQPLEGANGGHEDSFGNEHGNLLGGLEMIVRLGGYMVESNMGHIGDVEDPKAGADQTIYAFRAAAESARFSKFLAAQLYGHAPHHSYVWGGSGGGRRSPGCLEYGPDVWDGALPFMGGGETEEHGTFRQLKWSSNFPVMFNVQRILGDKLLDVVDAVSPGGSGDPYAGLDTHQREELANLYRTGFPRGDEWVIGQPSGVIWQWASMADQLQAEDDYYATFWTTPGYVGHDQPELVMGDAIDKPGTVTRVLCAQDFLDDPELQSPAYDRLRPRALMLAGTRGFDLPIAVEVPGASSGYQLGANVRITSGKAANRSLYVMYFVGDLMVCDGAGEASNLRFTDVVPGDDVHLDNRAFLAHCYYSRHHVTDEAKWDFLRVDGKPIYPQHALPPNSPFMGVAYSGQYEGKLLWVHHTHDASLWPSEGVVYQAQVLRAQGEEQARRKFRIRWTENAEHVPAEFVPSMPDRSSSTWLVDYRPIIEQSLADLAKWVEEGTEPAGTRFEYADGKVTLPPTAAERGGVQPVVHVSANGALRAEAKVGEPVRLEVHAEVPPGAGTIIDAAWDLDGSGAYAVVQEGIDGTRAEVTLATTHAWDGPGTYFATCLVHSHVDGDVNATSRRLPNLASARVVVS
jgi:Tannase and feruloyl esterase